MSNSRFSQVGFLDGAALGAALGIVFSLVMFWAISDLDDKLADRIVGFGTVVGALLSAFLALGGVKSSIEHQRYAETQRYKRKLEAAKATLPLVLSSTYEICENRIKEIVDGKPAGRLEPFSLDQSSIEVFERCIEFSDGVARETLKELLQIYQILIARYRGLEAPDPLFDPNGGTGSYFRVNAMIEWISFQALVESLFDYGRDRGELVDRAGVHARAVKLLNFLGDEDGYLYENYASFREQKVKFEQGIFRSFTDPGWKSR